MCWLWGFIGGLVFVGIVRLLYMFGSYLSQLGDDRDEMKWRIKDLERNDKECMQRWWKNTENGKTIL